MKDFLDINLGEFQTLKARESARWTAFMARSARDADDYKTALDHIDSLVGICEANKFVDPLSWRRLFESHLYVMWMGGFISRVVPLVARYGVIGWGDSPKLPKFLPNTPKDTDTRFLVELGIAITKVYPAHRQGWYLLGIGHELAHHYDKAGRAYSTCLRFTQGDAARNHVAFRAGAALLRNPSSTPEGTKLLRKVKRSDLKGAEFQHYVQLLTHSPSSLDRVRVLDTIMDYVEGRSTSDPADLRWLREYFLHETLNVPFPPSPIEIERIESIIGVLFNEAIREVATEKLEQRTRRTQLASTALADLAGDQLDELPPAALKRFAAYKGLSSSSDDPVAALLTRLNSGEDIEWDKVVLQLKQHSPAELLPYLIVWQKLIQVPVPEAEECLLEWIKRSPVPSISFWKLAASFQEAKFKQAGSKAAERAIRNGVWESDTELKEAVVWRSLNFALRNAELSNLRFWLESAEGQFAPK